MSDRPTTISSRGDAAAQRPVSYFAAVMELSKRLRSDEDPDGNIVMSIAENRLTVDLIRERLQASRDIPDSYFFYDNMTGSEKLKLALLGLLQHTFMQGLTLKPENLIVSAGCGAIVNDLLYCITSIGEGVALPAPYYPAFDYDIKCKNEAVPVAVHLSAHDTPYDEQLQEAADQYKQKTGKRLAVLLVTNPDNPTGTLYSEQRLVQMLKWCVKNKVHLISDEVYANSIFKPCHFTSMAKLAANARQHGLEPQEVQSYVHIIFGLSKDWCASGLRVGCLYTQNTEVLKAMQNLSYFACVSGMAQYMIAEMLEDIPFVDSYLKENAKRLGESYDTLAGALTKTKIKFTPAVGCVFCWIDLRTALPEPTWEAERELWEVGFVQRCGFIITPGQDCHASEPGFFRICYAIVDKDTILKLVDRLATYISKSDQDRKQIPLRVKPAALNEARKRAEDNPLERAEPES